jgi:hypothetical protein
VDGALGRGIVANRGYLDAVEPLLIPAEKLGLDVGPRVAQSMAADMAIEDPSMADAGAADVRAAADAAALAALEDALGASGVERPVLPDTLDIGD